MNSRKHSGERPEPEIDFYQEEWLTPTGESVTRGTLVVQRTNPPNTREESRLFDLIGQIDYKILSGHKVYLQVKGTAYKVLYGVYWRSVMTGAEYWGLKCEQIEQGMWAEGNRATLQVDLPIYYTTDGWAVEDQSLLFLISKDAYAYEKTVL